MFFPPSDPSAISIWNCYEQSIVMTSSNGIRSAETSDKPRRIPISILIPERAVDFPSTHRLNAEASWFESMSDVSRGRSGCLLPARVPTRYGVWIRIRSLFLISVWMTLKCQGREIGEVDGVVALIFNQPHHSPSEYWPYTLTGTSLFDYRVYSDANVGTHEIYGDDQQVLYIFIFPANLFTICLYTKQQQPMITVSHETEDVESIGAN